MEGVDDGDLQGQGEARRQAGRHHRRQLRYRSRGGGKQTNLLSSKEFVRVLSGNLYLLELFFASNQHLSCITMLAASVEII